MQRALPSGRVTFAFIDVVGSTKAFIEHGPIYVAAVQRLQARVAAHVERCGGVVVSTEGDGAMLAFPSAAAAVDALTALQDDLEHPERQEREVLQLRLRAGAHTGEAEPIGDLYVALPVYLAARVSATAGSGQVVVSQATIDDLAEPRGVRLGEYSLKDVSEPVTLWRVAGDESPPKAVPARRTNVAEPRTSFVGREEELTTLRARLRNAPVVTVVGSGGLGKTRLVSEFALRSAGNVLAGVWLVELAPLTSPDQLIPEIAAVLGMSCPSTSESVRAELARRGELVLILDNCEHLVDAVADLVTDLLPGCPPLRLLCTSREALEVPGEGVLRLGPLPTGASGDKGAAAAELFGSRATSAGATLGPEDGAAVTELCRLLDGVPMALELAAARASTMPVGAVVGALRDGDLVLSRRGGDERQRSLDSLVGWSLRLLTEPERDALFALAVFPGRFTAEMARTVLSSVPGVPTHAIQDLARRSLVDLDGEDYRMLVTVGDVARRELARRPDLHRAAMDGLFAWAVPGADDLAHLEEGLNPDQVRALQSACGWGLDEGLPGYGRLLAKLVYWNMEKLDSAIPRGLALRVLDAPLEVTEDCIRANAAALRLQSGLGVVHTDGRYVDRARQMVAAARQLGEPHVLFRAVSRAAVSLDRAGLHDEAQVLHQEALASVEGQPELVAAALLDLGVSYHLDGKLPEAEEHYRRAAESEGADRMIVTNALLNIGEVMLDTGRYDEASAQLRQGIQSARGRPAATAWALGLLAEVEARRGATREAHAIAEQAEVQIRPLAEHDPSLAHARDRMRAALASLT